MRIGSRGRAEGSMALCRVPRSWAVLFCWTVALCVVVADTTDHHSFPFGNSKVSTEEIRHFLTAIMASGNASSCPAPRLPLAEEECGRPTCAGDGDCPAASNQSCCFNGCLFTCTERLPPPPVIDWEDEIEPPLLRREGEAVLRCTTSPRPAPSEPVGCPRGYVCRIEDFGDPLERRYNSGTCVPDATSARPYESSTDESGLKEKTSLHTVYIPGGCVLTDKQFHEMKDFMTRPYVVECKCIEGSIECQIDH